MHQNFTNLSNAIALAVAKDYAVLAIDCQSNSKSALSAQLSSLGAFDKDSCTGLLNSVDPFEILSALSGAVNKSLDRPKTLIFANFSDLLEKSSDLAEKVYSIASYGRKTGISLIL